MSAPTIELCGETASNDPAPCVLPFGHPARHEDADGLTWSYGVKHGRPDVYEITWMSGHIERVLSHQVTYPHAGLAVLGSPFGLAAEAGAPRVRIHAEIAGRWTLTLAAREEDIRTMRLVTDDEPVPGGDL